MVLSLSLHLFRHDGTLLPLLSSLPAPSTRESTNIVTLTLGKADRSSSLADADGDDWRRARDEASPGPTFAAARPWPLCCVGESTGNLHLRHIRSRAGSSKPSWTPGRPVCPHPLPLLRWATDPTGPAWTWLWPWPAPVTVPSTAAAAAARTSSTRSAEPRRNH